MLGIRVDVQVGFKGAHFREKAIPYVEPVITKRCYCRRHLKREKEKEGNKRATINSQRQRINVEVELESLQSSSLSLFLFHRQ